MKLAFAPPREIVSKLRNQVSTLHDSYLVTLEMGEIKERRE